MDFAIGFYMFGTICAAYSLVLFVDGPRTYKRGFAIVFFWPVVLLMFAVRGLWMFWEEIK